MAYIYAWDEAAPAGSVAANTLDTLLQDMKKSVRERMNDLVSAWETDATDPKTLRAGIFSAGTVGAPGIAPRTFPDTGWYWPADGEVHLALDGVQYAKFTALNGLSIDEINELTAAAGVLIDGALIKDGGISGLRESGGQSLTMGAVADGQLLIRSGTNLIGATSGTVMPDGTEAAPGWAFSSDTDTGFYRPAANTLGLVVGGDERLRLDAQIRFGGTAATSAAGRLGTNDLLIPNNIGVYYVTAAGTEVQRVMLFNNANELYLGMNYTHNLHVLQLKTQAAITSPGTGLHILAHNGAAIIQREVLIGDADSYVPGTTSGYRALRVLN